MKNNKSQDQLEALKLIESVGKKVVSKNQNEIVQLNCSFTMPFHLAEEFDDYIEEAYKLFMNSKGIQ